MRIPWPFWGSKDNKKEEAMADQEEFSPDTVTPDEMEEARRQFMAELEARAQEGPEAVAEFFEGMAAAIRLATMGPDEWSQLLQEIASQFPEEAPAEETPAEEGETPEAQSSEEKKVEGEEQPAPPPQQEIKTESVREKIFSPRSAGPRGRGKSLREILNL